MREIFDRFLGRIADAVEVHSVMEWITKMLFWGILLWPTTGVIWQNSESLVSLLKALGVVTTLGTITTALWILSVFILAIMAIKGADLLIPRAPSASSSNPTPVTPAKPGEAPSAAKTIIKPGKVETLATFDFRPKSIRFKRDEEPHVVIGDMIFTEKDLCTSVLITGVTGTGKTSAAIFPMLEQLLTIYNEPTPGPYENIGGLCLDVKGEFFEGMIFYMHKGGRNVFEDIQVIRPNCLMPIVRFKDPATGFYFYLNGKPSSAGAESWELIKGKKFKDGTDIPVNVFTFSKRKLMTYEPKLKELVFDVAGKKMHYLGWRWQGDSLVRVTHTPAFNETHVALENGRRIIVAGPTSLVYEGVTFIDNGLRYNIVEPHKPPAEAAMRLNLISALAEGEKQTGENSYWYKRARAHIGSCIELWRAAYDETPQCTAQAIYKITQQDDYARKQVKLVETKIKTIQDQAAGIEDFGDRVGLEREAERMTTIVKYFTEEWGKYDSKTKTIIGSVVANAFDSFNKDPVLQDSFCQPKTFDFEECINTGKIFVLVPGDEYETVSKILGTALKMDFQSVVLSRMHRSELNQKRKIMLLNDECQKYVVAGGSQGAGDEHFMSLCRQSKCFNINATQADSWIISVAGKENSDVYLQNYNGRIWFRTNDKETAEKAEQLCGIKKQKIRSAGGEKPIHLENLLLGPKGSADHSPQFTEKEEEKPRFPKDKFYNLEMWECIMFNGTRTGSDKACQSQLEPSDIGSPEGEAEKAVIMKLYFQGYLENIAYKQGKSNIFDHIMPVHVQAAQPAVTEGAPTAALPPAATTPVTPTAAATTVTPSTPRTAAPATTIPVLEPAAPLSSYGDSEQLKARANKLLKSVQVIAPKVASPAEGTIAPFPPQLQPAQSGSAVAPATPPPAIAPAAASPSIVPTVAPSVPDAVPVITNQPVSVTGSVTIRPTASPTPIPLVDKNFSADAVTPKQLHAAMQNYQDNPQEAVNTALAGAHFVPPVNPADYLVARTEEEMQRVGDPALAIERAAIGPKGMQGGNPNYAMATGGAVSIPAEASDNFEKVRDLSLKEEQRINARSFVRAITKKDGPTPDLDTLSLLKDLKPEVDENKDKKQEDNT